MMLPRRDLLFTFDGRYAYAVFSIDSTYAVTSPWHWTWNVNYGWISRPGDSK